VGDWLLLLPPPSLPPSPLLRVRVMLTRSGPLIDTRDHGLFFLSYTISSRLLSVASDEPIELVVGDHSISEGVDAAVCTLGVGEEAVFSMSHHFAYGEAGLDERKHVIYNSVPPRETVLVTIKLVSFEDPLLQTSQPKNSGAVVDVQACKDGGNRMVAAGRFPSAVSLYERALAAVAPALSNAKAAQAGRSSSVFSGSSGADLDMAITCLSNLALCHLKLGMLEAAVDDCNTVLELPELAGRHVKVSGS
jgi:hypothetical protein